MKPAVRLREILQRIDKKGYKAYKDIKDRYDFSTYQLIVDHVQGDPYSTPSRMRVRVDRENSGFKPDTTESVSRCIALRDFLARCFFDACKRIIHGNRGIGRSGLITIDKPCQAILDRSAMVINDDFVEARFFMGLPAFGRSVSGRDAEAMFFSELPKIVDASLFYRNVDQERLYAHIKCAEDADFLRARLDSLGLIAFVAEDALLPRESGISPKPLPGESAILFQVPEDMSVDVDLPNHGRIKGMGIPKGVTLIVGGGYHGKSTLLNALELGIYNHIPEDGRERVVTVDGAVKIRAADGRSIRKTDISPFINNLPFNQNTVDFSTENASGSTSQAAGISEAAEIGATVLMLDEDTSATNFMIRDFRMQQLVAKEYEPITPFVDKVKYLYAEKGISTILVMGGSGDYFSVADHVIQMTDYVPKNVSDKAKEIAATHVTGRKNESADEFGHITDRIPDAQSFNPVRINGRLKISARGQREILFGSLVIDCWDLEQVVNVSQTRAIGYAIQYATRYMDGTRTLKQVLDAVMKDLDTQGLDILPPYLTGDLARFRIFELAAAINRMRTLKMNHM